MAPFRNSVSFVRQFLGCVRVSYPEFHAIALEELRTSKLYKMATVSNTSKIAKSAKILLVERRIGQANRQSVVHLNKMAYGLLARLVSGIEW